MPSRRSSPARLSIGSGPDDKPPRYYTTLLSAIRNAEQNVWISTAYFVPTSQEVEDLVQAAKDAILHSKSATIDGVWPVIGSSNFEHRSVFFNDEVDAVVLGRDTASALQNILEPEMNEAAPVDREAWATFHSQTRPCFLHQNGRKPSGDHSERLRVLPLERKIIPRGAHFDLGAPEDLYEYR